MNIEDIMDNYVVIHCPTKLSAEIILTELDKLGCRWETGDLLLSDIKYNAYGEQTCYRVVKDKKVVICDLLYYKNKKYQIIDVGDFIEGVTEELLMSDRQLLIAIYRMLKEQDIKL